VPAEILVLGGGVGGSRTANLLARQLPAGSARVRVVDATGLHVYQPGFLYLAFGQANGGWLARDLRSLLRRDVGLIVDRAQRIDTDAKVVHLEQEGPVGYDHLVIATGSHLDHASVPGLSQGAHGFYSLKDAERLREELRTFQGGTVIVGIAGMPYKCPPAPVEFVLLLEEYLRKRGVRDRTTIKFLSPLNRVFTIESASQMVAPIFEQKGIELHTFVNIESVDPDKRQVLSLEGETFDYDLAVLVPPHRGAEVITASGLGDRGGWLPTDRHSLRVEGVDDVYAIGDCTDLPISKSGSTAHYEAHPIVEQIVAAVEGRAPEPKKARYEGQVMCFFEMGDRKATIIRFDYDHPPGPPKPSVVWHLAKWGFNRAYWYFVPRGIF